MSFDHFPQRVSPTVKARFFCSHKGAINEALRKFDFAALLEILSRRLQNSSEDPFFDPLLEPAMAGLVRWIPLRELFLPRATEQDPQNAVQHLTVASSRSPSSIAPNFQLRQMSAKHRPLFVIKAIFVCHRYAMVLWQTNRYPTFRA